MIKLNKKNLKKQLTHAAGNTGWSFGYGSINACLCSLFTYMPYSHNCALWSQKSSLAHYVKVVCLPYYCCYTLVYIHTFQVELDKGGHQATVLNPE